MRVPSIHSVRQAILHSFQRVDRRAGGTARRLETRAGCSLRQFPALTEYGRGSHEARTRVVFGRSTSPGSTRDPAVPAAAAGHTLVAVHGRREEPGGRERVGTLQHASLRLRVAVDSVSCLPPRRGTRASDRQNGCGCGRCCPGFALVPPKLAAELCKPQQAVALVMFAVLRRRRIRHCER